MEVALDVGNERSAIRGLAAQPLQQLAVVAGRTPLVICPEPAVVPENDGRARPGVRGAERRLDDAAYAFVQRGRDAETDRHAPMRLVCGVVQVVELLTEAHAQGIIAQAGREVGSAADVGRRWRPAAATAEASWMV